MATFKFCICISLGDAARWNIIIVGVRFLIFVLSEMMTTTVSNQPMKILELTESSDHLCTSISIVSCVFQMSINEGLSAQSRAPIIDVLYLSITQSDMPSPLEVLKEGATTNDATF